MSPPPAPRLRVEEVDGSCVHKGDGDKSSAPCVIEEADARAETEADVEAEAEARAAAEEEAVVDQFSFAGQFHDVTTLLRNGRPLFRALDVGRILGLKNVHASMRDFGNPERSTERYTAKSGGNANAVFLTELGVWTLACKNRSDVGKHFRRWVFEVLRKKTPAEMTHAELLQTLHDLRDHATRTPWLRQAIADIFAV